MRSDERAIMREWAERELAAGFNDTGRVLANALASLEAAEQERDALAARLARLAALPWRIRALPCHPFDDIVRLREAAARLVEEEVMQPGGSDSMPGMRDDVSREPRVPVAPGSGNPAPEPARCVTPVPGPWCGQPEHGTDCRVTVLCGKPLPCPDHPVRCDCADEHDPARCGWCDCGKAKPCPEHGPHHQDVPGPRNKQERWAMAALEAENARLRSGPKGFALGPFSSPSALRRGLAKWHHDQSPESMQEQRSDGDGPRPSSVSGGMSTTRGANGCADEHDPARCGWCDCGKAKPCAEHGAASLPARADFPLEDGRWRGPTAAEESASRAARRHPGARSAVKIARITYAGIKSKDASHDLTQATIFNGPVASGKSTPLDAIRFAALGCVPDLGADEAAASVLMREGLMTMTALLDDERAFARGLNRKNNKLAMAASASWLQGGGAAQAGAEITALFGANKQAAMENLDLRALLRAGPGERAKRIEELLDVLSDADSIRWAFALTLLRLAKIDAPDGLEDAERLAEALPRSVSLSALINGLRGDVLQLGVVKTLELANKNKNASAKLSSGSIAARTAIEQRLGALPRPKETRQQLEQQRDEAQKALTEAKRDLSEHGRIGRLIRELGAVGSVPDAKEAEGLRAEIEGLSAALGMAPQKPKPQAPEVEKTLNEALANPWREVEEIGIDIDRASVLRYGGEFVKRGKRLIELAVEHGSLKTATIDMLRDALDMAKSTDAESEAKYTADACAYRALAGELGAKHDRLRAVLAARDSAERRRALTDALPVRNVDDLTEIVAMAESELSNATESLQQLIEADARRQEMEAMAREIAKATEERDFYAAAEWALKVIRDRDTASRSGGLIRSMQTFLRAAGRAEEPYIRVVSGKPEYGLVRGAKEIPIQALSGGEAVMFCAALAGAIIHARNPQIKLLMLEGAELGDVLLDCLGGCMGIIRAGLVDQVLVATNAAVDIGLVEERGWSVIRTGETK